VVLVTISAKSVNLVKRAQHQWVNSFSHVGGSDDTKSLGC